MHIPNLASAPLKDFLNVLFKRKITILLFFSITICTVAIVTLVMKPTYEASAQLIVKVGRENLYVPTVPSSGDYRPIIRARQEGQINSEIEILKSRSLAEEVIKSLGLTNIYKDLNRDLDGRDSPLKEAFLTFKKALKAEMIKKSDVIEVRFKHEDPQMAATVVNTLIKYYLDRHLQVFKSPQSSSFFQRQKNILGEKLMQAETNLEDFKKQHDLSSLDKQKTLLLEQQAKLRAALNQALSEEAETENRLRELRMQLARTPKTVPQDEVSDHNPYLINTLQARLVELQLKEKKLLLKYTEENRLVRNIKEEIQIVQNKLTEQENKLYGMSRSGLNPTYQRLHNDLLQNEAELKALHAKRLTQSAQRVEYQQELEGLSRIEVELRQLKQEVDVDRENYKLYLSKMEESRISDAMDTNKMANVSLIEAAQPPIKPVSPKVFLNIILSIFLGSFGGLGLAFFLEYLDDSLEDIRDVEEYLQVPVLASVPKLSN
jgi:uncharacterized protein involved in exopolysaccharide biosynthesis